MKCQFCGLDPYEYVNVGIGCVPVAVTCCAPGVALYQHGDLEAAEKIAEYDLKAAEAESEPTMDEQVYTDDIPF